MYENVKKKIEKLANVRTEMAHLKNYVFRRNPDVKWTCYTMKIILQQLPGYDGHNCTGLLRRVRPTVVPAVYFTIRFVD